MGYQASTTTVCYITDLSLLCLPFSTREPSVQRDKAFFPSKSLVKLELRSSMWSDITALCRAAAGELSNQHPMINIEDFSLHDAMSAVEVKEFTME